MQKGLFYSIGLFFFFLSHYASAMYVELSDGTKIKTDKFKKICCKIEELTRTTENISEERVRENKIILAKIACIALAADEDINIEAEFLKKQWQIAAPNTLLQDGFVDQDGNIDESLLQFSRLLFKTKETEQEKMILMRNNPKEIVKTVEEKKVKEEYESFQWSKLCKIKNFYTVEIC